MQVAMEDVLGDDGAAQPAGVGGVGFAVGDGQGGPSGLVHPISQAVRSFLRSLLEVFAFCFYPNICRGKEKAGKSGLRVN